VPRKLLSASALLLTLCSALLPFTGCAGISSAAAATKTQESPAESSFSISGTIGPAGSGAATTVVLRGTRSETTTTATNGSYQFSGLPSGTYTVMPSKSGANFAPASRSVTISASDATAVNFSASQGAATFSIMGNVGPGANGAEVIVTLRGAANLQTTTDSNGNYIFSGLAGGNYTVTPAKPGFAFTPPSQNATVSAANVTEKAFNATADSSPSMFIISGTISPSASGSGAMVTLSGAANLTAIADSNGNYTFSNLPTGAYTVTPSKNGFAFAPASHRETVTAANVAGANFSASANAPQTFSISGTIAPSSIGSGVKVSLSGAASQAITTNSSGNYSFSGLTSGSYTVTVSKSGFIFSPASHSETIGTANITGANFNVAASARPTFSISGTISPAASGSGTTVSLSGPSNATTSANSSGNYGFTGLPAGTYTVSVKKSAFTFGPSTRSATISNANLAGIDFTASSAATGGNTVNIYPGNDIPSIVNSSPAGTTFLIYPGTYRLTESIVPKNGDSFIGQTACQPPASSCAAIISGSRVIGPQATFDGTDYKVLDQTQQGQTSSLANVCDNGWSGCIYPEDLFFDHAPLQHLKSSTRPSIASGQWWFDYRNHVIYFHDNPSGHVVETSVLDNAFGGWENNVTIQYLTIEEFANMFPTGAIGTAPGNVPQTQGANWTVQNNEVLLNHGFGVRVNYGIQVLNNYVHDNGQTGIAGGIASTSNPTTESMNSNILIQGNTINHNDYAHFSADFGAGGVKTGATSGIVLRGNTIQHNEGAGIHFDVDNQNELVDGNTITDNTDSDGLVQEIGYGRSIFRNNIVLRNGAQVNSNNVSFQIDSRASSGVVAYCNVMEVSSGPGINGWAIGAANRGYSVYPPYQYLVTTGSSVHHNTVIWDTGASGIVGYLQNDAANQPNFFASNAPPDFNTYHLPSAWATDFIYGRNSSLGNAGQTFPNYQVAGADVHGTIDTNYTSGYPSVSITSPNDLSSVTAPVTITASASDGSGISKVEFYVDWVLQATTTANPYSFNWTNGTSGSHTVTAMAYSNAGISACYAVTLNAQ
jgi:hypothetical protein